MRCGVRCAETTFTSQATSNSASASAAARITGQSESLPMITPTGGASVDVIAVQPFAVGEPVRGQARAGPDLVHPRAEHGHVADLAPRPLLLAVVVHVRLGKSREQVMQPLVGAHRRRRKGAEHV